MSQISRRQLIVSGALAAGALAGSPRLLREASEVRRVLVLG